MPKIPDALLSSSHRTVAWRVKRAWLIGSTAMALALPLQAGAQTVVSGQVGVATSGATTTVTQTSQNAIVNWPSLSVPGGATLRFDQPNAAAAILNRVTGGDMTRIQGSLEANGRVFLINPNGVVVGPGGRIDTAGFLASTLDLADDDFLAGRLAFKGDSTAAIENRGAIAARAGDVFLIGRQITNAGQITAVGRAILAGGTEVLLGTAADGGAVLVRGSGAVDAAGAIKASQAQLRAAGGNPYALAVNLSGLVQAGDVTVEGETIKVSGQVDASGETGGRVRIGGGWQGADSDIVNARAVEVTDTARIAANARQAGDGGRIVVWSDDRTDYRGSIAARGGALSGNGGKVEISGKGRLAFAGFVDTMAAHGDTGSLLLDPATVRLVAGSAAGTVSGGTTTNGASSESLIGVDWLTSQLATTAITVSTAGSGTGAGDILVEAGIFWSSANALTLDATRDVILGNHIVNSSAGSSLVLKAGHNIDWSSLGGPSTPAVVVKSLTAEFANFQPGDFVRFKVDTLRLRYGAASTILLNAANNSIAKVIFEPLAGGTVNTANITDAEGGLILDGSFVGGTRFPNFSAETVKVTAADSLTLAPTFTFNGARDGVVFDVKRGGLTVQSPMTGFGSTGNIRIYVAGNSDIGNLTGFTQLSGVYPTGLIDPSVSKAIYATNVPLPPAVTIPTDPTAPVSPPPVSPPPVSPPPVSPPPVSPPPVSPPPVSPPPVSPPPVSPPPVSPPVSPPPVSPPPVSPPPVSPPPVSPPPVSPPPVSPPPVSPPPVSPPPVSPPPVSPPPVPPTTGGNTYQDGENPGSLTSVIITTSNVQIVPIITISATYIPPLPPPPPPPPPPEPPLIIRVVNLTDQLPDLSGLVVTTSSGSTTVTLGDPSIFDPNYNPMTAAPTYATVRGVFGLKYGISGPEFDAAYGMGCEMLKKACSGAMDPEVVAWMDGRYTLGFSEIHAIAGKRVAFETAPLTPYGYPVALQPVLAPYLKAIPAGVVANGPGSPEYRGAVATALLVAVNEILAKPQSAWTAGDWGLVNYVEEYVRNEELTTARQVAADYEAWRDEQFKTRGAGMTVLYDYGPNPKDQDFYARATIGVPVGGIRSPDELARVYSGVNASSVAVQQALSLEAAVGGGLIVGSAVTAGVLSGSIVPFATAATAIGSTAAAIAGAGAGAVTVAAGIVFSLVLTDIIKIQETNDAVYGTIDKRVRDGKPLNELIGQTNGQQLLLMHLINMTSGVSYR